MEVAGVRQRCADHRLRRHRVQPLHAGQDVDLPGRRDKPRRRRTRQRAALPLQRARAERARARSPIVERDEPDRARCDRRRPAEVGWVLRTQAAGRRAPVGTDVRGRSAPLDLGAQPRQREREPHEAEQARRTRGTSRSGRPRGTTPSSRASPATSRARPTKSSSGPRANGVGATTSFAPRRSSSRRGTSRPSATGTPATDSCRIRYLYHPRVNGGCKDCAGTSWPNSENSTAFNVDLFGAEMRGCYNGMSTYLRRYDGRALGLHRQLVQRRVGHVGRQLRGERPAVLRRKALAGLERLADTERGATRASGWLQWERQFRPPARRWVSGRLTGS